jgi:hypothetical protein
MRALWYVAPGVAELRAAALRQPGPDECRVRMLASGLSRGTERLVLHGRVPESQWPVMRAPLQEGDFPFPVKYGYSAVGLVEAGPMQGQRVFCLHPHQEVFIAPAGMCLPVPDSVPTRRAVLAANMETAANILWDAAPLAGERALVVGAGVVGLLVTFLLARIPGIDLAVCDVNAARRSVIESFGAHFCLPDEAPAGRDLVIHASANEAGLRLALERCGFEGRIIEASWYGDKQVALPLGEAFHSRRLRLVCSQVGAVAPAMRGRRSHAERLSLALSLLDDARLDAQLGPEVRFTELPQSLAGLLAPDAPGLCPVITYG